MSFLTDASSEMIYPLLPSFLSTVLKAGPAYLGVIEGVAEATASALKLAAGRLSDRAPRRKPFVVFGYGLSTVVRPLIALAAAPWHVLAVRVADRVGKGTRGAPRDAILAAVTPAGERGRAYGFHRAMDHAGAVVGPVGLGRALGHWRSAARVRPGHRTGASSHGRASVRRRGAGSRARKERLACARRWSVRLRLERIPCGCRKRRGRPAPLPDLPRRSRHLQSWKLRRRLSPPARPGSGNAPRVHPPALDVPPRREVGREHVRRGLVRSRGATPAIVLGRAVYAIAYVGFALASGPRAIWLLFAVYGLFHALTEGPEKALVADLAPPNRRGWAFGLYHAVTGAMLLPASLLTRRPLAGLWSPGRPRHGCGPRRASRGHFVPCGDETQRRALKGSYGLRVTRNSFPAKRAGSGGAAQHRCLVRAASVAPDSFGRSERGVRGVRRSTPLLSEG